MKTIFVNVISMSKKRSHISTYIVIAVLFIKQAHYAFLILSYILVTLLHFDMYVRKYQKPPEIAYVIY